MKISHIILLAACISIWSCNKKDDPIPNNNGNNNNGNNNNNNGNNGNDTNTAMVASFTYTADGWVAHFKNTSTENPTSLAWDFGDGTQGAGDTITHTYANPGNYNVRLIAKNATKGDTIEQSVTMKEQVVEISTSFGKMYMYLYNQVPAYRDNFLKLTKEGFFDGTTFHRIISGFVIQGGDPLSKDSNPNNDGTGGPGYTIPFSAPPALTHDYGAVGAASTAAKGPSSGSQFYIVVGANGQHGLDGNYAVFGYIMKGMDVATTIMGQPKNSADRPTTNISMTVKVLEKTKTEVQAEYGYTIQ